MMIHTLLIWHNLKKKDMLLEEITLMYAINLFIKNKNSISVQAIRSNLKVLTHEFETKIVLLKVPRVTIGYQKTQKMDLVPL